MAESVPAVLEADAHGEVADVYADIRSVLGTSVVNLIWRNLATMPGALEWTWSAIRPLYLGAAPLHAEAVRRTIALPEWPGFSTDTLAAAGVDEAERALIRGVLDSHKTPQPPRPRCARGAVATFGAAPGRDRRACRYRAKTVQRQNPGIAAD